MDSVQKKKQKKKQTRIYCQQPQSETIVQESTSVTSMHEKKKHMIHTKKARCKIFTNRYKNIDMNKLISSTFLYCPATYSLLFPTNGKETWQT